MTGILVTDNAHVNGSIVITANASWDLNGLGPVYGKFVLTPDEDLGTWEGTWEGKVTETGGCWKEDAVGRGGYNGMHLKMTEVYNPVTYTGELTGYIDE